MKLYRIRYRALLPGSLASLFAVLLVTPSFGQALTGGTQKFDLPAAGTTAAFTFTNSTGQPICDCLLSTNDSDNIDPDFEGDVVVRRPPGGADQGWVETPAPADGVEDIKTAAPAPPANCIPVGAMFSVGMTFDALGAGDILYVTPTNVDGHQIVASLPHSKTSQCAFFNGYAGLPGSLVAAYLGTNGSGITIAEMHFASATQSASIAQVTSSLPSSYNAGTGILTFTPPVAQGAALNYRVTMSGLATFVSGDPDPYTRVDVAARSNVIPALGTPGIGILLLLVLGMSVWFLRRKQAQSPA